MSKVFLLLMSLVLCAAVAAQTAAPQRIVSMNVCTDQLLLLLVDKARITSVSQFAADPLYSSFADAAAGITLNRGQAEQVMQLQPDLVLTSMFSATLAATVLQRLHRRVERLGFATTRDDVYRQIAQLGAWTGEDEKAAAVIADMRSGIDRQIAALTPLLRGRKAVMLSSNGVAFGGGTLQDDFLHSVGLHNIAADAGLHGPAKLSLELLLAAAPDYVITEPRGDIDRQQAHPVLLHPGLAREHVRQLALADRWFDCAGPWLTTAYESLAAQLVTP
ncbi:MAG TPA: ABC transporter substrate-binding protein [Candidatus Acidoferrum sp.]|nr:ABC transporter substrate-binding protein [Candidatus Acidoferrum sp.]